MNMASTSHYIVSISTMCSKHFKFRSPTKSCEVPAESACLDNAIPSGS